MTQLLLGEFGSDAQLVASLSLDEKIERAIRILRENAPPEGYYLAFSGGKDSVVILHLAKLSGVSFEAHYNNTTIDPPELVRFIKSHHPGIPWNNSEHGNMFHRIATSQKIPPTRAGRWCCEEYKEYGGENRFKIFGVRADESAKRRHGWKEITTDRFSNPVLCPIVYWSGWTEKRGDQVFLVGDVWDFIRKFNLPYCSLYDEGRDRIGCVGCMLQSARKQEDEFKRWPHYEKMWKSAVIANWEKMRNIPNSKTGAPRYHAKFATGEEFWQWWRYYKAPDVFREDCQSGIVWTNEDE